jgi:Carbohydrate esterase, sialic acid-specific acetylesterase
MCFARRARPQSFTSFRARRSLIEDHTIRCLKTLRLTVARRRRPASRTSKIRFVGQTIVSLFSQDRRLRRCLESAFGRRGIVYLIGFLLFGVFAPGNVAPPLLLSQGVLPTVSPLPEIWIISGQSNAVGCARGASLDGFQVEMWAGTAWQPAHEPLAFMEPYKDCQVGPWLSAARAVGRPVRLTGWGRVGIPIDFWAAGAEGWRQLEHAVAVSGQGARWFLWFQGEADAVVPGQQASYAVKLADLIVRVREAAKNPTMNVLIVGLADAPFRKLAAQYAAVRAAQQQVAARDPRVFYISAEGLPIAIPKQPYHLTDVGYSLLALRITEVLR